MGLNCIIILSLLEQMTSIDEKRVEVNTNIGQGGEFVKFVISLKIVMMSCT